MLSQYSYVSDSFEIFLCVTNLGRPRVHLSSESLVILTPEHGFIYWHVYPQYRFSLQSKQNSFYSQMEAWTKGRHFAEEIFWWILLKQKKLCCDSGSSPIQGLLCAISGHISKESANERRCYICDQGLIQWENMLHLWQLLSLAETLPRRSPKRLKVFVIAQKLPHCLVYAILVI